LVVNNPPLSGADNPLTLPSTIKCHVQFGNDKDTVGVESHSLRRVRIWKATGSMDEQNGETAHACVNQLLRMFGNTRGEAQKKLWFCEFHWIRCGFITEAIAEMLKDTKRKSESNADRKAVQVMADDDKRDRSAIDDLPEDENGMILSDESKLRDDEIAINECDDLRGPTSASHKDYEALSNEDKALLDGMDTKIHICPCDNCDERFLGSGALRVHAKERHNLSISADLDGDGKKVR